MSETDASTANVLLEKLEKVGNVAKLAAGAMWALLAGVFFLGVMFKGSLDRLDRLEAWKAEQELAFTRLNTVRRMRHEVISTNFDRISTKTGIPLQSVDKGEDIDP